MVCPRLASKLAPKRHQHGRPLPAMLVSLGAGFQAPLLAKSRSVGKSTGQAIPSPGYCQALWLLATQAQRQSRANKASKGWPCWRDFVIGSGSPIVLVWAIGERQPIPKFGQGGWWTATGQSVPKAKAKEAPTWPAFACHVGASLVLVVAPPIVFAWTIGEWQPTPKFGN